MSKKSATTEALEVLHAKFAEGLADILVNGEKAVDKETGELVVVTPSPAMMSVIRQFLKDNGVESADIGKAHPRLAAVTNLPFAGADGQKG